jgi:hypothetical protein
VKLDNMQREPRGTGHDHHAAIPEVALAGEPGPELW